jgi:hypothetical protein
MHNDDWKPVRVSRNARILFACIHYRSGGMRMGPLMRRCGLRHEELRDVIKELADHYWITITLKPPRDRTEATLNDIERIATTWWGRRKFSTTWWIND